LALLNNYGFCIDGNKDDIVFFDESMTKTLFTEIESNLELRKYKFKLLETLPFTGNFLLETMKYRGM